MKRRLVLGALAAAGLGATAWARPRDRGAPYEDRFRALNDELRAQGPAVPCMVLDLDALDRNIDRMRENLHPDKAYRLVAKSLPSEKLIEHVLGRTRSRRLMTFHQPFMNRLAERFPDSDLLLGKPMPVRAAARFHDELRGDLDPQRQVQWLVDTPQRLAEYLELANGLGLRLRVNIEIDVGLRRGGVADDATMAAMAETIAAHPDRLRFAGLMGYDPHVVLMPGVFGGHDRQQALSIERYRARMEAIRAHRPALMAEADLTWNGAGSPNYRLHREQSPLNDVAVGSALVKPTDFDLPTLSDHEPALYIAAPVLKRMDGTRIPGVEGAGPLIAAWNPNRQVTHFIYGGRWQAEPHAPAGLMPNTLYGRSSNQDLVNGSRATALAVDDHIFLRPTQSEAVMLQFGDLVVVRDGHIVDRWPVFPTLA